MVCRRILRCCAHGGERLAAQAVPVIGALGGAVVNYTFIDHFQEVARAHFVVRRLERRYGKAGVIKQPTRHVRYCSNLISVSIAVTYVRI